MERIMSQEERIRRAEEIYQRRKNKDVRINTGTNSSDNSKGQIFIFKNLFLKITICAVIYTSFYVIKNSNYFFFNDVLNKVNEILSYDMNFKELYNSASEYISNFYSLDNNLEGKEENSQNSQNSSDEVNNQDSQNNSNEIENQGPQNNNGEVNGQENVTSTKNESQVNENQNNEIKSNEENANIDENKNDNMARSWRK